MQNFLSLGYMLRVLLAVSANFPDNPRKCIALNDFLSKSALASGSNQISKLNNSIPYVA